VHSRAVEIPQQIRMFSDRPLVKPCVFYILGPATVGGATDLDDDNTAQCNAAL